MRTLLQAGWSGWVARDILQMREDAKPTRPWSRLKADSGGHVLWIPRSSKQPREGLRWAVKSPPGDCAGFDREGWFIVSHYVRKPFDFAPGGPPCGVLPPPRVEQLHQKLEGYYWDNRDKRVQR